jgi:hypothetical protein
VTRRGWEVAFLLVTAAFAALTVITVPPSDLAPWSAGVLGPLVVVGAAVCVLSWPPRFGPAEDPEDPEEDASRPPWRLVYLAPAVVTALATPALVSAPFAGLAPYAAAGLLLLLAYVALLLGAAAFLVVLLPLGQLLGWWRARLKGRPTSPYVALTALLVLALAALGLCSAVAFDGLPNGPMGLVFALLGLAGIRPTSVVVAHPAWLLAARASVLVLVAVAVGFVVLGRRPAQADKALPP